jgi:hypothetical protein
MDIVVVKDLKVGFKLTKELPAKGNSMGISVDADEKAIWADGSQNSLGMASPP